jgi:NitT/TauT family transport system substrate-binding protein
MQRLLGLGRTLILAGFTVLAGGFGLASAASAAAPLTVGYSDWPGWIAWQVAIDKGWLTQAGLDVKFQWFDYSASLSAYAAGKLDADLVANVDALVNGSGGAKSIMIMLTDYSSGNDMIVAKPPFRSMKSLKGQKIGIEVGVVEQLLLDHALEANGMTQSDVTLINTVTNETPQVLASGSVAAIGAWEPNSGMAMQQTPGARPVYTSAEAPGLIYDALAVSPASLSTRRADWIKLIKVWAKVVAYINDPATQPYAIKIMAARVGLTAPQYKAFLGGTHLLDLAAGNAAYVKGPGLNSIYGSTENADAFNVANGVYKTKQNVDSFIDGSLEKDAAQ